jgi:hypothetical protein
MSCCDVRAYEQAAALVTVIEQAEAVCKDWAKAA